MLSGMLLFYTTWIHQKIYRFSMFLGDYRKRKLTCNGSSQFFCYTTMVYFWKYLQAAVVPWVHTSLHKRFRNVVFWKKYLQGKKFSELDLTSLKRTVLLKCICFGEIWCLYLVKRSYNFNNFHFYTIVLWLTLLLNFHQLFMVNLIVVCCIVCSGTTLSQANTFNKVAHFRSMFQFY